MKYKSVIEATRRINNDPPNIVLSDWSDSFIRHFGDCARWRAVLYTTHLKQRDYLFPDWDETTTSGKLNSVFQPMLAFPIAVR